MNGSPHEPSCGAKHSPSDFSWGAPSGKIGGLSQLYVFDPFGQLFVPLNKAPEKPGG